MFSTITDKNKLSCKKTEDGVEICYCGDETDMVNYNGTELAPYESRIERRN